MKRFKKFNKLFIILFLLLAYIVISAISYVSATSKNISDGVLRLHVIANSDSQEDQNLKLIVRDSLLNYMNKLVSNSSSKEFAIETVQNHKQDFQNIAEQTIKEQGYNYNVKISIGNFYFPTKSYGDISFPAGYYDALKVEIGKAEGQNWWCVMFPPLCFIDMSTGIVPENSKETLKENLDNEEFALISNNSLSKPDITFKFKLVEFFNKKH